ncbi:lycopene cyclase domain-containing protein [Nocardia sp. NPDC049149]|uniref:lycopene cyclase domain-containing protein n=1 Tax=Nocardia sp. NPDC049149 TaxID=3364315 RepID=UPI0037113442
MEQWHYLFVLIACLVLTAPLEFVGPGVYRRPRLLLSALAPLAVFIIWDLLAIAGQVWNFNERYIIGLRLPGAMPIEELLFFMVVPLCGLLTFVAVDTMLGHAHRSRAHRRSRVEGRG